MIAGYGQSDLNPDRYYVYARWPDNHGRIGTVTKRHGRGSRGGRVVRWTADCLHVECRWNPGVDLGSRHGAATALEGHYRKAHAA